MKNFIVFHSIKPLSRSYFYQLYGEFYTVYTMYDTDSATTIIDRIKYNDRCVPLKFNSRILRKGHFL